MPAHTTPNSKSEHQPNSSVYTVTQVEHELRVAFSVGGLDSGMEMAKDAANEQSDIDVTILEYLKEKSNEMSNDLEDRLEPTIRRELEFYRELEQNLRTRLDRAQERLRYNEVYFETHMVVEDDTDLSNIADENNPIHVGDLDHLELVDFADYELDLPTPLLCAHSDRKSTSIYPFIPNNDVLTCTCGDKQNRTDSPLCFHELAALLEINDDNLDPEGPETWLQLASPLKGYN